MTYSFTPRLHHACSLPNMPHVLPYGHKLHVLRLYAVLLLQEGEQWSGSQCFASSQVSIRCVCRFPGFNIKTALYEYSLCKGFRSALHVAGLRLFGEITSPARVRMRMHHTRRLSSRCLCRPQRHSSRCLLSLELHGVGQACLTSARYALLSYALFEHYFATWDVTASPLRISMDA